MKNTSNFISASEFKAKCLNLMEKVKNSQKSLIITKHGKPIAQLSPIEDQVPLKLFGLMKGSITIKKDIIAPIDEKWDVEL